MSKYTKGQSVIVTRAGKKHNGYRQLITVDTPLGNTASAHDCAGNELVIFEDQGYAVEVAEQIIWDIEEKVV